MNWAKVGLFAGGVAATLVAQAAGKSKKVRQAAVNGLAACMVANDNLQAGAQSIVDDASDLRAEAERERQVDAAVQQRLGELEAGIREEVVAKMNGTAAKAAE